MKIVCQFLFGLFFAAVVHSTRGEDTRDPLAWPGKPPVVPAANAATAARTPTTVDAKLLAVLHLNDYRQREDAVTKLVQFGPAALPALQELVRTSDPDTAWWAQSAIQQIAQTERGAKTDTPANPDEILKLMARGAPQSEVVGVLWTLSPADCAWLVDAHLRLALGIDYVCSLRPDRVLPRATLLLAAQTEPFYQMVLLRLMRNCVERAVLPPPGSGLARLDAAVRYLEAHAEVAALVRPYLDHPLSPLRLEALRFSALTRLPLSEETVTKLLADPAPGVSREARRLALLLLPAEKVQVNAEVTEWVSECMAALAQEADQLARLGALYALLELTSTCPVDLDRARQAAPPGLPKDTLVWLLGRTAVGRLALLRAGGTSVPTPVPAALAPLLALRDKEMCVARFSAEPQPQPGPELAFFWRNLVNGTAGLGLPLSLKSIDDKSWRERFLTANGIRVQENGGAYRFSRPGTLPGCPEFSRWYGACAKKALSPHLWVATGAVRGLLCSDMAGARALVHEYGAQVAKGVSDGGSDLEFARDLLLLHHNVGYLPAEEVPPALRTLWLKRGLNTERARGSGDSRGYDGQPEEVPMALWSHLFCDDIRYCQGVTQFVRRSVGPRQVPLLVACLDLNPASGFLLLQLDARETAPAFLWRVQDDLWGPARPYWSCYLNVAVQFSPLEAAPYVEREVRSASNPTGIALLAGLGPTGWGREGLALGLRPSPLAAGTLREPLGHFRAQRGRLANKVFEECEAGLKNMGVPVEGFGTIALPARTPGALILQTE